MNRHSWGRRGMQPVCRAGPRAAGLRLQGQSRAAAAAHTRASLSANPTNSATAPPPTLALVMATGLPAASQPFPGANSSGC
jgi:hypothetical protein